MLQSRVYREFRLGISGIAREAPGNRRDLGKDGETDNDSKKTISWKQLEKFKREISGYIRKLTMLLL